MNAACSEAGGLWGLGSCGGHLASGRYIQNCSLTSEAARGVHQDAVAEDLVRDHRRLALAHGLLVIIIIMVVVIVVVIVEVIVIVIVINIYK